MPPIYVHSSSLCSGVHALNGWNNFGLQQQCVQYVSSLSDETTPIEISVFAHREESKAPAAAAFAFHGTGLFLGMAESTTMTLSRELVIVTMNCFSHVLIGTGVGSPTTATLR